jgi:hypothetical protein
MGIQGGFEDTRRLHHPPKQCAAAPWIYVSPTKEHTELRALRARFLSQRPHESGMG